MADRTETAAVVVVGCGPGGAVLAYLLARSGVDVALVERAATFEREYRGFGWNPGVVRLFDEMDVLDDVRDLAHETVTEGGFSLYGEAVTVLDFDLLDAAHPYALMMEQPALLACLVDRADESLSADETRARRRVASDWEHTRYRLSLVEDALARYDEFTDRPAPA
jgi:2-polyprenyl-6-methoxyphenol hydroxylase-like FAD-dependent oxidoreductase